MAQRILSVGLDSGMANLSFVSALIQQAGRRLALDEVERYHLELAVAEAVANCARHAYDGTANQPIHVAASIEDDRLLISVSDSGKPAALDLEHAAEAAALPPELQEGGRGLFLICSLMDRVEHVAGPSGNTLLMTKFLRPAPGAEPDAAAGA
jgi:serine/threonine-protein kinase RsbW